MGRQSSRRGRPGTKVGSGKRRAALSRSDWRPIARACPVAGGGGVDAGRQRLARAVAVVAAEVLRRMTVVTKAEVASTAARGRGRWRAISAGPTVAVDAAIAWNASIARAVGVRGSVARAGLCARTVGVESAAVVRAIGARRATAVYTAPVLAAGGAIAIAGALEIGSGRTVDRTGNVPRRRRLGALGVARPVLLGHRRRALAAIAATHHRREKNTQQTSNPASHALRATITRSAAARKRRPRRLRRGPRLALRSAGSARPTFTHP
jgi:hypothetical protein